ncbi:ATP-binding protein [Eubacterium sp.]|uniref:ATP-binding protein n=1 Tax=Eubacterium sp. TaxID=142586 RepID=UPI0025EEEDBB|nr:ATP-binding protein [Eubacterium sp.]MCR5629981.1 putative DNA binding domain-containing protein [Eubacterium sp.]
MKESKTVEFKSEVTNTFLKTVSAYANFCTGVIEFGILDSGKVKGLEDVEKVCLDIENKINDSIKPKPDYCMVINENNTITLHVYEGKYKPYLYKGKAYRRSDTSTVEVEQLELKRLTLEGNNMYYEDLSSNSQNLKFSYFESKLVEKIGIKKLTDDMLRTFGFYNDDRKLNNAAELFADKNSFNGIDVARFGKSISEILDRETFSNCCILKQFDDMISMFKRYYQYERIKGFDRELVELIPEEAFREAIANALVHRTWDIDACIKVSMFEDKVVITSPGGLPRGISKEEYLNGNISYLRNPIIGNVFFRMHYIEMFGTGIQRILEKYKSAYNAPIFEIFENSITITLPVISLSYSVTTDGELLLETLNTGLQLSSSDIVKRTGWSKDKTIREINILKDAGYVKSIGKGRATRYIKN